MTVPLGFMTDPAPQQPAFNTDKIPLEKAQIYAYTLKEGLNPVCSRIAIAGSVRRGKPLVKDIELVAIEKFPGACYERLSRLRTKLKILPADFWIHPKNGISKKTPKQIACCIPMNGKPDSTVKLDLFLSQPEYWGYTFFVRTGSKEWNEAVMKRLHSMGARAENNKIIQGDKVIYIKSEIQFFDFLKLDYTDPNDRINANSVAQADYRYKLPKMP